MMIQIFQGSFVQLLALFALLCGNTWPCVFRLFSGNRTMHVPHCAWLNWAVVGLACTTQGPDPVDHLPVTQGVSWGKRNGCPRSSAQMEAQPHCGWTSRPSLESKTHQLVPCLSRLMGPSAWHLHVGCLCAETLPLPCSNCFLPHPVNNCRTGAGLFLS